MTTATLPAPQRSDIEVISVIGFVHGVSHFFHLLLPPLFPWLMPEFGLSFTAIGTTMTVFFIVSGIGQASAGFLVDRFGAARVLGACISCFALAGVLMLAWALWRGERLPTVRQWRNAGLVGALMVFGAMTLVMLAQSHGIGSGLMATVVTTMPMWLACTSMFSVWAWRAGLMLHCQATTPSVLL